MRDAHVRLALNRVRIDPIEFRRRIIGSARPLIALVGLVRGRGHHQADFGLVQWLGERREWHVFILRPPIGVAVSKREIVIPQPFHIGHRHVVFRGEPQSVVLWRLFTHRDGLSSSPARAATRCIGCSSRTFGSSDTIFTCLSDRQAIPIHGRAAHLIAEPRLENLPAREDIGDRAGDQHADGQRRPSGHGIGLPGKRPRRNPERAARFTPCRRHIEGRGPPQYMCWPPLIDIVEPVTKSASSPQRNTTPRAMSWALPRRRIGMFWIIFSSTRSGTAATMSVST